MSLSNQALQKLKADLEVDEGFEAELYRDKNGFLTGGYGHNFDVRGIPQPIASVLLLFDIDQTETEVITAWPYYLQLSEQRKTAIINLAFNVGIEGLLQFKKMIAAIEANDFHTASLEIINSTLAHDRKLRLAKIMEENSYD